MPRRFHTATLIFLLLLTGACKGPEDYLKDLGTAHNADGRLNLLVYDAGLLVHEALTALLTEDTLTLSQLGRALYFASWVLEKNDVALCRADAVALLVRLALAMPIRPPLEPYREHVIKLDDIIITQIERLHRAGRLLAIDGLVDELGSPDRAVVERAHHKLISLTEEDFPPEAEPWTSWWESRRTGALAEAVENSREPLEILSGIRFQSLVQARAPFEFLTVYVSVNPSLLESRDFRDGVLTAMERMGRHLVVFGIRTALKDKDSHVRLEAARGARLVLDPTFAPHLVAQLALETDADVRNGLLQALAHYPSSTQLKAIKDSLRDRNPAISITAQRILAALAGQDLGSDPEDWDLWYDREGKRLWQ